MKRASLQKTVLLNRRVHFIILGIAWLVLHGFLLNHFGIVTDFEATKYIEQAQLLIKNGSYSSSNFTFYSTQILLVAFCIKLNVGFWFLVCIQLIANAFSLFLFFRLVQRFTQNSIIPFFATLFFLCMFYYQLYNVHLFTESLFFSFSIIFTYFLFSAKRSNILFISLLLFSLVVLSFTRPTGILFIPPTLFFLIFKFGKKKALPLFLLSIVGGLILFYFLLNAALNSGGEFDFLLPYIEEHVICGVPTIQQAHNIVIPVNKNSVEGLWYIIKNNDNLFLRLAKERFIAFWGVLRPFYSLGHNLFIAAYFYTLYVFVLWGLRRMFRYYLPQTVFLLTYIFLIMLTVLLSCDEWHNRFIFSILPFLLLLAVGPFIKKEAQSTIN
jgi:hypothetical protein